jgi:hypothetical protein
MKNSKQPLNELDISTYYYAFMAGKLIAGGIALQIIRKVVKYFGSRYENIGEFFRVLRNPKKLKQAGVADDEMRTLYSNGGAAIVDLGKAFSKEVFNKVKAGKLTPEQAVEQLEGIIPESSKADWLKKFRTMHPSGGKVASSIAKATYSKVVGPAVTKEAMEAALSKVYGFEGLAKAKRAYEIYLDQYKSGKLVVPFKNKSTFPGIDEWTAAVGWKPKNPNIGLNDRLVQQKSAYRWHKLIWTLHH